jgi:HlyD family secretion protein
MRSGARFRLVSIGILAAVLAGGIYLVRRAETPSPIQGVVRATEVRVAPEVGGHLAAVRVRKGDHVRRGDVLAELSAAELSAQVDQARAAYQSALADRNNVYAGVRSEEIATSAAEVDKANSRLTYSNQQLSRYSRLVQENFAPRQSLDNAQKDAASARATVAEATANHAAAKAGPTRQERAIADARVSAAAAQVAVLESRLRKTALNAPADGVVRVVAAEVGEAIRAGQTIITIEDVTQPWLSFNVREDRLGGMTIGSAVEVNLAGESAPLPGVVTEISSIGQFATWQAERAVGDHDRNTLRLRVELRAHSSKIEPGMTVWLVHFRGDNRAT